MDIEEAAVKKLARKSMSVSEMRAFLKNKGFGAAETEECIEKLKGYGYLDDARFSEEYFRYAFGKNRSRRRIFAELKEKGVSDADASAGLEAYAEEEGEPDERAAALDEALKVIRLAGGTDSLSDLEGDPGKIKGRIARRLASRGFSQSVIYDVLSKVR